MRFTVVPSVAMVFEERRVASLGRLADQEANLYTYWRKVRARHKRHRMAVALLYAIYLVHPVPRIFLVSKKMKDESLPDIAKSASPQVLEAEPTNRQADN